jgi:hypothetical protein
MKHFAVKDKQNGDQVVRLRDIYSKLFDLKSVQDVLRMDYD